MLLPTTMGWENPIWRPFGLPEHSHHSSKAESPPFCFVTKPARLHISKLCRGQRKTIHINQYIYDRQLSSLNKIERKEIDPAETRDGAALQSAV